MAGYKSPEKRVHREFLYLDSDTVVNSLSALEAGKIDEIIQKANEAREGGFGVGLRAGGAEASGSKKKSSIVEEELVITRTMFSAFQAWHDRLSEEGAFGSLDGWSLEISNEIAVGDTIEFTAKVTMAPLHLLVRSFLLFAKQASNQDSPMAQQGQELKETKKSARMVSLIAGIKEDGNNKLPVYLAPNSVSEPRVLASLDERYMVRSNEDVEGVFTVIAQVEHMLNEGEEVAVTRFFSGLPPTPLEIKTTSEAWQHMIEPAKELGVDIKMDDITVPYPAVIVRPIAIFR